MSTTTLFYPLQGDDLDMTGNYGEPRPGDDHGGVDLNAAYGSAIYAAFGGTLTIQYDPGRGGYGVYVEAPDGTTARYWHMFNNDMTLAEVRQALTMLGIRDGMQVAAGQVIGTVGHSGNADGDHLHFSVYVNGETVDPGIFNYTTSSSQVDLSGVQSYVEGISGSGDYPQMLAPGSQGQQVSELQRLLTAAGFNPGPIDGIFGAQTAAAVRAFQSARGLPADGVVGPDTADALGLTLATGSYQGPPDTSPVNPPAYSGAGASGVLGGGSLVRIQRPNNTDLWVMVYEFPRGSGQFVGYQFDDAEQVLNTFGTGWETRVPWANRSQTWLNNNVEVVGTAGEIIGVSGNWNQLVDETFREISGINDPTILGQMLNDPEIHAVMVAATLGDWDEVEIAAALRNTSYWTDVLYPGIDSLYGMTSDPESTWLEYEQSVEQNLSLLGIPRDPDGSYRTTIGQMLNAGIDEYEFAQAAPIWQRAATNADYFRIMQQWVSRETGQTLTFDNWFDLIAGTAPAELQDIANRAAVQYQAEQVGFDIGAAMIERVAENTLLSEREIAAAFNQVERQLYAMGDTGLKRYGLNRNDLISAATGIQASSGRSHEWIRAKARQAAIELSLLDNERTPIFVGYSAARGTPQRPGMTLLTPEGA